MGGGAAVFDKQIIEKLRQDLGFKDPGIFEKAVYALNLLPPLLEVYPSLIFKGGTSLLLHQYPPARLSIDIDILLPEKEEASLNEQLAAVAKRSGIFKSIEEDVRSRHIPKAHFKFFYDSHFSKIEQNVLLDVVFCENPYPKIVKKSLKEQMLILQDTGAVVTIPTAEGLFGDKLTAISPKTLGLKLTEGRDMEFLKQIIDLGSLFKLVSSIDELKKAFGNTVEQENGFRESRFTREDVIGDILDVAWKYSQWMVKGADSSFKEINSINRGLERISNHLVGGVDSAALKVIFGKIAYILRLLRTEKSDEITKNIDALSVQDMRLEEKYKILEKLKVISPEAYFYWVLAAGVKG
ncbi:MAG TPA: hypothetical protein DCL49_00010 [Candidatus Omnitrophica bacterium]|nr:hypothetical protein [Candidatus Omnitrophota bacterium]